MKELEKMKKAFDEFMAKAEQTIIKMKETAPKEILDKKEKEYLENLLRPFRDKVEGIIKKMGYETKRDFVGEYLVIDIKNCPPIYLPYFKQKKYYKGMEPNKEYTLDELGLFKE